MGLFGASKILVLILIIAAVWYGFKFIARRNQNVGARQPKRHIGSDNGEASGSTTQDMESCSVCGTFVPNTSAKSCGREACPYPE
jgi:uncharacterized protein